MSDWVAHRTVCHPERSRRVWERESALSGLPTWMDPMSPNIAPGWFGSAHHDIAVRHRCRRRGYEALPRNASSRRRLHPACRVRSNPQGDKTSCPRPSHAQGRVTPQLGSSAQPLVVTGFNQPPRFTNDRRLCQCLILSPFVLIREIRGTKVLRTESRSCNGYLRLDPSVGQEHQGFSFAASAAEISRTNRLRHRISPP